jgi:hypothetical protein
MWKTLIAKELRENAWIAAIALIAFAYLVIAQTGWASAITGYVRALPGLHSYGYYSTGRYELPFIQEDFYSSYTLLASLLAIALGFRQSIGESLRGTFPLLLRLPTQRWQVFGAKLLAGLLIYLVCAALPIVAFAAWAAVPGTHASPFYWAMTVPAWVTWWTLTPFYFAAFLSGLRPARWAGSRLLPLATAAFPVMVLLDASGNWWISLVVVAVADGIFLACILRVTRVRDYS